MSTLQPPNVATWLLEHLQPGPNHESLAGDLFEEYQQGRSRIWYWKEVLAAIILGLCRELIAHPVLALRAIATAWAVQFFYLYAVAPFLFRVIKPILPPTWFRPIGPLLIIMVDLRSIALCGNWLDRCPLPSGPSGGDGGASGAICFLLPTSRAYLDLVSRKEYTH
jgi:hypothetical protein